MSNDVFPALPGLLPEFTRSPMHKTQVQEAVSGAEYRGLLTLTPRYLYQAQYEFLRDRRQGYTELASLLGFFNAHHGQWDSWCFDDPDDNTVAAQPFGTGDGATTAFQLVRTLGGFAEPVYALNGSVQIFKGGVLQAQPSACSVDANGLVTFVSAPAAAAALTWTGAFYWRCRFSLDQLDFQKFAWRLWNLQQCEFVTLKPPF
jgi:uncharacterized protein (TIGR02217 family)